MAGRFLVGISGWRYAGWRGDFYPSGLPQRRELEYAAARLTSIEINGSFYSLQRAARYAAWHDTVPADFVLAVKGGRFVTHLKRLVDVEGALANFFASGVLALGAKLGPVLWQLPESLTFDADRLARFFELLPRTTKEVAVLAREHDSRVEDPLVEPRHDGPVRHALEFRSASFVPGVVPLLREHRIACVLADTAGRWPQVEEDTADFRYVRLHGDTKLYSSGYDDAALDGWAARCRTWREAGQDVHVYFDNDAWGHAPHDAVRLLERG